MADVAIKYNGAQIAEMAATGNKTLKTSGKYCAGDIAVEYTPRSKTYEITLTKASGWVLLTTLDADVLEHINDATLTVVLRLVDDYAYEYYSYGFASVFNVAQNKQGTYPVYGISILQLNETSTVGHQMYYKPNDTSTSKSLGNPRFRLSGNNYYFLPGDGFLRGGKFWLTFTW